MAGLKKWKFLVLNSLYCYVKVYGDLVLQFLNKLLKSQIDRHCIGK